LYNADNKILGRAATQIALLLMGKNKPYYVRHLDCGDNVVIINAEKVKVTGKKISTKIYTSYSGYPGGIKKEAFKDLIVRRPEEVLKRAVSGMLPKNKLRDQLLKRLYIFSGTEHKFIDKFKKN
jgi:large subunit ribosomal protein L13